MLCTLANLKAHLGIGAADTEYDAVLTKIIGAVSAELARIAGRVANGAACLELQTGLVLTLNVPRDRTQTIYLPCYPVKEISEIKEALFGEFAAATALTANTEYQLEAAVGGLWRVGYWLRGVQTVRVTWTGGYVAAGGTPAAGETALPADIEGWATIQCAHEFLRRTTPGASGQSAQGANVSWIGAVDLLPIVRRGMIDGYGRRVG